MASHFAETSDGAWHQAEGWSNAFPALARLKLATADFEALKIQGFVCSEARCNKRVFKLRLRRGRRQQVRYIGSEIQSAQLVEEELAELQRPRRLLRRLVIEAGEARQTLRQAKQRLAPALQARGYHFHGQTIRRRRRSERPV